MTIRPQFPDFLVPGLILGGVFGIGSFVVAALGLRGALRLVGEPGWRDIAEGVCDWLDERLAASPAR